MISGRFAGVSSALAVLSLLVLPARAVEFTLEVEGGDSDRIETPVCATLTPGPVAGLETIVEVEGPGGKVPGQLLPSPTKGSTMLCWLVSLKKGEKATYKARVEKGAGPHKVFVFNDEKGQCLDLLFDGRKVTRFMYAFTDDPDSKKRFPNAKPFTHVFDAKGEKIITSPGGQPFPHHRGIFLGYKVTLPDKKATYDYWHVPNCWERVEKFAETEAGPVAGRMTAIIHWADPQGKPVIIEERTITVYRQSKPELLLDFVATLHSQAGDLSLGGDPEHAGVQFRAHYAVGEMFAQFKKDKVSLADINAQGKDTRYLLPPGMKEGLKGTPDLPWASISFYLNGSRFNVAELNAPENPKGTIFSANRDYGRFGAFPKTELKADQPLTLRYRFFVRETENALTAGEVQRLYDDFAKPPKVTVRP